MKKRVLIFYGSYGAGHFSAARSIKEYIDNNYKNIETNLVDCMEYLNKHFNKLSIKTYDKITRKLPVAWKGVYYGSEKWAIRKITSGTNRLFSVKLFKIISKYNPDLIICTHFFPAEMCAILKKNGKINCDLATVMTDYAPHKQWLAKHKYVNYYFVANNEMKISLEKCGIEPSKIHVTGIPLSYKFLLDYNKKEILKEFDLKEDMLTVLFFAGGSSHIAREMSNTVFNSIVKSFSNIQTIAITGKSPKLKVEFENLVKENHRENNIKVLPFTNKVPELMHISDIVISKPGGLTTTESLSCGLPMIVIDPIPGQEEENAEFLEKNGAAIWLKKKDNVEQILNEIFNDKAKLNIMKENAKKLAKKESTQDICEVVL